jgi:branched-chain amino acid transport system ATP-binding protein
MSDPRAILQVENLEKHFGAVAAASEVNIDVKAGEIIGIIGANGAGKTTFVNMVTGYLKPDAGTITFEGRNLVGLEPREVTQSGISRSFQVSQVFATMTVFENVLTALAIARNPGTAMLQPMHRPDMEIRCNEVLERYKITEYRDHTVSTLSQGVRKLLDIAMAVVSQPRILLLDEPTSGVSVKEKFDLMDIVMKALREDDVTVLFIEHDMEIVERYVSRVIAFYLGRIICDKTPAEALADPDVREYVLGVTEPKEKKAAQKPKAKTASRRSRTGKKGA